MKHVLFLPPFSPSDFLDRPRQSITIELSALIDLGSGGNWLVDIFNRGPTNTWVNIGDLSSAGDDWTTVALTLTNSALTDYLDASADNEMLVRVYTTDLLEVCYAALLCPLVPGANP